MARIVTKEELLDTLNRIQHKCHQSYNCDTCIFKYEDGIIEKCVFCGVLNIDCFPPDSWNLEILRKKMLGGTHNGEA